MDRTTIQEIRNGFIYLTGDVETALQKPYLKTAIISHLDNLLPHISKKDIKAVIDDIYSQWAEYEIEANIGF